eukprot:349942_1
MTKCTVFEKDKPKLNTVKDHVKYLNNFIEVSCRKDEGLQKQLVAEFCKCEKWKTHIKSTLDVVIKLNAKETVKDYLQNRQGMRNWGDNKARLDKQLGFKTRCSLDVVRKAKKKQQMKTANYQIVDMQVSKAKTDRKKSKVVEYEMQKTVLFNCNPFEQLTRTIEMELREHKVEFNYSFGIKTIMANEGTDKWAEGILVSLLVSTRETNNNSAFRRRPIGFAQKPKDGKAPAETTYNMCKLYENIRNDLELLKENTCILSICLDKTTSEYHCAPLCCEYVNKLTLDKEWQ